MVDFGRLVRGGSLARRLRGRGICLAGSDRDTAAEIVCRVSRCALEGFQLKYQRILLALVMRRAGDVFRLILARDGKRNLLIGLK